MKSPLILFWPGRGKDPNVLAYFLSLLKAQGYNVITIPFEYDTGISPLSFDSEWKEWCTKNDFSWWIGISLGASLAYTFASLLETRKPKRLTLINPFMSREILAKEKGFSLKEQWNFSPIEFDLRLKQIDIVTSVMDEKIPMYHSIQLLNKTISNRKNIIFIDDTHQISNVAAQKELAELLIDNKNIKKEPGCGKTYYCNIYQR